MAKGDKDQYKHHPHTLLPPTKEKEKDGKTEDGIYHKVEKFNANSGGSLMQVSVSIQILLLEDVFFPTENWIGFLQS